jgi:hypothetical protein
VSAPRNAALPVAAVLVVLVLVAAVRAVRAPGDATAAARQPARGGLPARHFPDGPGRAIAERSCLACHSAMLVTQQRKDSLGWVKTVSQMEAWSAPIPPQDRDSLLTYLGHHFGAGSR